MINANQIASQTQKIQTIKSQARKANLQFQRINQTITTNKSQQEPAYALFDYKCMIGDAMTLNQAYEDAQNGIIEYMGMGA